jgi:periplasmic divalent cation tolerance protein
VFIFSLPIYEWKGEIRREEEVNILMIWKGEIRREEEVNILIKTDDRLYSVVEERLKEIHPYEIPLIFALQADYTSAEYAAWVNLQTGVL